jgi:hypothetical protein
VRGNLDTIERDVTLPARTARTARKRPKQG